MKLRALFLLTPLLAACPVEPMPPTDGGGGETAPIVTSINPTSGSVTGGTSITITGTQFVSGATVTVGSTAATSVTFESDRRLVAVTPAATAAGAVGVTVTNPGGKSSTLPSAFTYTGTTSTRVITEATLTTDASSTAAAPATVTVAAEVLVPMTTNGAGQGGGVRAQVGYATTVSAPPVVTDFMWSDASYLGDAQGDLSRDAYSGTVTLTNPGDYFVTARFSVDNGATWTLADRDGAANGVTEAQLSRVTVAAAGIGWCKLGGQTVEAPPVHTLRGAATGPTIYAQVFKEGVTNSIGAGPGIKGALGYGAAGTDPATWTWVDAAWNVDTGSGQNDEFQAVLPNPGPGTYKFAFRFNSDDGAWTYCDADGLDMGGFTEAQAGTLTVETVGINSCKLQFPTALTSYEGRATEPTYGRVFVQGVTEATGAGAGIEGQVGYGPPAVAPSDAAWQWSFSSLFNVDDPGGGDEFRQNILGPVPGTYGIAWRFRIAGGAWTYCDLDGSDNGIQEAQLGVLTALPFDVTECVLEATNQNQTVLPATTSQPYTALVTIPTLTDGPNQGSGAIVQIGSGPVGSTPSTWTNWTAATYRDDATQADRYEATLTSPASPGSVEVAFRVQVNGRPFVYCDRDGMQNGYQSAQAGRLTSAAALINACRLQTVSAFNVASGAPLTVTARTRINGVSSLPGASPNLRMQVGVGPQGDNASSSALWGWREATYASEQSGEDEFSVTTYPAYTGPRAVSARASLDGTTWTYCDLNGSDDGGYQVDQQYNVTVTNHAEFDYCNLQFPFAADAGTTIYGQLYEPGLTPNAAAPVIAQLGYGVETEDPGLGWTWTTATFGTISGNNNEYQATLPAAVAVGQRYTFRYTVDAGVWCYGDIDGSQNGFTGGGNIGVVTP